MISMDLLRFAPSFNDAVTPASQCITHHLLHMSAHKKGPAVMTQHHNACCFSSDLGAQRFSCWHAHALFSHVLALRPCTRCLFMRACV